MRSSRLACCGTAGVPGVADADEQSFEVDETSTSDTGSSGEGDVQTSS